MYGDGVQSTYPPCHITFEYSTSHLSRSADAEQIIGTEHSNTKTQTGTVSTCGEKWLHMQEAKVHRPNDVHAPYLYLATVGEETNDCCDPRNR